MDSVTLAPAILFSIAGFPITNAFVVMLVVTLFLVIVARLATRRLDLVPRGVQFWVEQLFSIVYNFIQGITGKESSTRVMFPFVMTFFLFILVGNFFAYIPGLGAFTYGGKALYRTVTSDYSFVLMLTLVSFFITQATLVLTGGPVAFIKKFINVSGPWSMKPINMFLGGMDLIGEFAKIISLSFRLFGNMFAGEVLGAVVGGLMPFVLPLPFAILGLLTAVVQPSVFSVLTTLNVSGNIVTKPGQGHG